MSLEVSKSTDSVGVYNVDNTKNTKKTPVKDEVEKNGEPSAVYEKGKEEPKVTYKINKMSEEDRAQLVQQLKTEEEARNNQLLNLVSDMLGKQAKTFADATDLWRFLAKGDYEVDAETKAQAQADIAEDGYYGVKQTSQRLFDFASALAGDDVDKMKKMQAAMEKGFAMATKTWGGELPSICRDTIDAANKLFDNYYASKEAEA